jgi:hypothetical protein
MKTTLSTSQAVRLLLSDTNANWSPAGARALIEYLEDFESSQDVELELDIVALRCDYSEYDSALQAALDQGFEPNPTLGEEAQSEEDKELDALDWLTDHTTVIKFPCGIIIANF